MRAILTLKSDPKKKITIDGLPASTAKIELYSYFLDIQSVEIEVSNQELDDDNRYQIKDKRFAVIIDFFRTKDGFDGQLLCPHLEKFTLIYGSYAPLTSSQMRRLCEFMENSKVIKKIDLSQAYYDACANKEIVKEIVSLVTKRKNIQELDFNPIYVHEVNQKELYQTLNARLTDARQAPSIGKDRNALYSQSSSSVPAIAQPVQQQAEKKLEPFQMKF